MIVIDNYYTDYSLFVNYKNLKKVQNESANILDSEWFRDKDTFTVTKITRGREKVLRIDNNKQVDHRDLIRRCGAQ